MPVLIDVASELMSAVDRLSDADPTVLADGETIVALHRQLDRLEAVATRATAAFDAARAWEADGARSAAAWTGTRCNLPMPTARRRVRLGRELRHMPAAERAWLCGEIGEAHVGLLARARTPTTAESFARDEELLVGHARDLRFGQFARLIAYWCYHSDPEEAEDESQRQLDDRHLHLSRSFEGCGFLDGMFDPISLAIFEGELRRIELELFEEDWAEAKARVGEGVSASDLRRSAAQRRLDALVEMARRSAAMPAEARLPEPLFSVFVAYETLAGPICELANGTPVTPGSLLPYLDRAWLDRVVFDGPSRVIDVGVRRRLFGGATRRAVMVRDRECFHELCDIPAEDCQVDHIEPWAAGGPTVEQNGRPACAFHNRGRHRRT